MDLFFQGLYLEYIYLWILGNKDYYEEKGISMNIDPKDSYKIDFHYHGFNGIIQIYKKENIIEETILDENDELLFYLHYSVLNLNAARKFILEFFRELHGDLEHKHIGISGSSGITSSAFVEGMQQLNDLLHLPYKFDVVIEKDIEEKHTFFDLILLPPQSSYLEPYFERLVDDHCVIENIDATVFATNDYQGLMNTIKKIFEKS